MTTSSDQNAAPPINGISSLDYPSQPGQKPLRWIERSLVFIAFLATFLAVLLLLFWLYFNLIVPAQGRVQYVPQNPTIIHNGRTLQIEYPTLLLADDKPAEVRLILRGGTPTIKDTFVLTGTIPYGLAVVTPTYQANAAPMSLIITPTNNSKPQTEIFALINTKTIDGFPFLITKTVVITSNFVDASPLKLTFSVESTWGTAMRSFVNSSVNEKSPLIIVAVALLSGAGVWFTRWIERELEREKAEHADRLIIQIREYLEKGKAKEAQSLLTKLEREKLETFVLESVTIAKNLVKLFDANLNDKLVPLVQNGRNWPDACVAAYLKAHEKLSSASPAELREALLHLPRGQIKSIDLQDSLDKAARLKVPIQPFRWPDRSGILPTISPSRSLPFLETIPNSLNPFGCKRAEEDVYNLFSPKRGAFWPGHSLLHELDRGRYPYLVFAPGGSGRSALALALGRYHASPSLLSLYLPGQPTQNDIRAAFTRLLLNFCKTHPTRLSEVSVTERELLSHLFVTELGQQFTLAELQEALSECETALWLQDANKEQKPYWISLSRAQLQLLKQDVSNIENQTHLNERGMREIVRSASVLKFERVILVLDVTTTITAVDWANQFILPNLWRWHLEGLPTLLFLPSTAANQIQSTDSIINQAMLTWNREQLVAMVQARYRAFAGQRAFIQNLFADSNLFDKMIDACTLNGHYFNPRRFIQLWDCTIRKIPSGQTTINLTDLRRGIRQLSTL